MYSHISLRGAFGDVVARLFTSKLLTESLAFLRSCSSSPTSADFTTSFSKHAEPREELFWWDMIKWETMSFGHSCPVSSGLLADTPTAPSSCCIGCPLSLFPGTAVPPSDRSPGKVDGVEEQRLGCEDEKTRSNCLFFLLNIHNPVSFLLSGLRRSETNLGLKNGLVFS